MTLRMVKKFFIKRYLEKSIKEITQHRRVRNISFDKVKTVLVLYLAESEEEFIKAEKSISDLQAQGKKVVSIGFYNSRKKPVYIAETIHSRFLSPQDHTIKGIPNTSWLSEILTTPFDVLIDLSFGKSDSLIYIALHSNAHFKTGSIDGKYQVIYDLLIQCQDADQKRLIEEIAKYMDMFNNHEL